MDLMGENKLLGLGNERHTEYCEPAKRNKGGTSCSGNSLVYESVRNNKEGKHKLDILSQGKVVSIEHLGTSGSKVYIVTLEYRGETKKAIFKYGSMFTKQGEDRELAAVAISQTLSFDNVPLGLLRTITVDGEKITGFIQEFIDGKTLIEIDNPKKVLSSEDIYIQYNSIAVFDYLIGNTDRGGFAYIQNHYNWIIDNDGKLWAIDHAEGFRYILLGMNMLAGDKQIPIEVAEKIVNAAKDSKALDELISHFSFLNKSLVEGFKKRIELAAESITIEDGKAFIDMKY